MAEPHRQAADPNQVASRDERLAMVLAHLIDELRRGCPPNLNAACDEQPDLADELRALWAAVQLAEHARLAARSAANASRDAREDQPAAAQPATGPVACTRAPPAASSGQPAPCTLPATLDAPLVPPAPDPGARPVVASELSSGEPNGGTPPHAGLPARSFADFELLEQIGQGGMGVVYRARQRSLGRTVAVKMILRGASAPPQLQARFQAEARAVAQLDHPGIVQVYEAGEVGGQLYFAMQYIAGETLAARLERGPLPPREAARLLAEVAEAIDFAHRRGVLHRDLKPSNILLDGQGRPHVTDFGLARNLASDERLTLTGEILGTPSYMAPEQVLAGREALSPATDVYGLGAILYEAITGVPPVATAATPREALLHVLEQEPLPPRQIQPRIDPDLEMICLRAMQKPADLRYPSAAALAADLRAYLANEPVTARSGRLWHVLARWFRETHHAPVLHNWGLLWMWHSLVLFILCLLTQALKWHLVERRLPYVALWTAGLGTWAAIFWWLRRRMGPVTFVERQIAHVWAGSMAFTALLFEVERQLRLPVLSLSPVLALVTAMVFLIKGGILGGQFYVQAAALFAAAAVMPHARVAGQEAGLLLYGLLAAASFFFPGLKYHRQRRRWQALSQSGASP
jgi:serine/threonine-protein kinase